MKNTQSQRLEKDVNKLSDRFNEHLKIYAENGKALYALQQEVKDFRIFVDAQLKPIRNLVFGAVGLILVAFMGSLTYTTFQSNKQDQNRNEQLKVEIYSAVREAVSK